MRNYYHKQFLKSSWNAFFSFYVIFLLFISLLIMLKEGTNVMFVPLCVLCVLIIADLCIQMKTELVEYVFVIILIVEAAYLTYEGSFYTKYQFHEIWLIQYSTFLIISISCCFHWKRMIVIFWFTQVCYFIILHITYDKISIYFYPGFLFITILLPLVCMIIANIILTFLMMIHNNQELIKTIKKILLIFPEAILIQTVDEDTGKLVVQLVNDTAVKEIIEYNNPCGQPVYDDQLKYCLKLVDNSKNSSFSTEDILQVTKLSSLLESHVDKTQVSGVESVSSIELCIGSCDDKQLDDKMHSCRHYNVKTVQLKWGTDRHSYIHVFVNTTAVKQIEVEVARNDCLQLMFSSISHEFRTPLNAFSNSALLLESNYLQLVQKIDRALPQSLAYQLLSQSQRESNERFYTICKISTASLMSLVEDILDLAKLEAGTFSLNEQPFVVSTLVRDIENIFQFQCVQKGLTFRVDADSDLLESTFCSDAGRIKQVLMNLISNSLKFTQVGGISITVSSKTDFDVLLFERVRLLEFKVSDTGLGIDDKDVPNLFKMFRMASQQRNKYNCRGTGIGLTISKKLVESLGGAISLTSQVEVGTHVTFTVKEKTLSLNKDEESKRIESSDIWLSNTIQQSSYVSSSDYLINHPIHIFETQSCDLSSRRLK